MSLSFHEVSIIIISLLLLLLLVVVVVIVILRVLFEIVVMIVVQSVFRLEMHQNEVFSFLKIIFDISILK